ncbi:MAG TPA: hypothetical protein PLL20_07600 [Phycisphaerae bacterium]|nr:hypothetical protein [Phycisphaerae bacterium]HRR86508.1 hypothetical protein [Phycisphaerae bacterium]
MGTLGPWTFQSAAQSLPASTATTTATSQPDRNVEPIERPAIAGRRVVKHFDFDEQRFGNYDPYPMYWKQHEAAGFPLYLEGKFDANEGHDRAPSFRLDLNGGSIAFHYVGRDISVRTNSDYLVVAWCKTSPLTWARAYVTARYLDRKGRVIEGTQRCSELLGGTGEPQEWVPLMIGLPGNVPDSRYIGISVWLTQASTWNTNARPMRSVEFQEIKGSAWFDDITVYRLPRVCLRTSRPGNVFTEMEPVTLHPEVSDPDGLNLSAKLAIRDAEGQVVEERPVSVRTTHMTEPQAAVYRNLPVGAYTAELDVVSDDGADLVRRKLGFVRLASQITPPTESGRGFGIVLQDMSLGVVAGQRDLLLNLHPELVKVPVWWSGQITGSTEQDLAIDHYLEMIAETQADPVGILANGCPPGAQRPDEQTRSMLEIFSEDPIGWKPLIAGLWSRYAGLIHVWQVGADGDASTFLDHKYPRILPALVREMKSLMTDPLLASTINTKYVPPAEPLASYNAVLLSADVPLDDVERHLAPFLDKERSRTWITVEAPPEGRYPRLQRLSDLSRRLVEAHFQKTGGVFLTAPWAAHADLLSAQVDPSEDYVVFRTIADLLGGTEPVSRGSLDGQAKCMLFDRNGRAIMMVWDEYAPPGGREHTLWLGENAEQVDLWGVRRPLQPLGKYRLVSIGPVPTFIINVPTWLMEFCRQFVLAPPMVEFSFDAYERDVIFRNTYHEPISGLLRLLTPPDWDVRPNRIPFALQPNEVLRSPVQIRFPINAEAAVTPLVGEFEIDADQRYQIVTPAWFELGLENIDVNVNVYRLGTRVVVQQTMTNRTDQPVSFEGYVVAPARKRMGRRFINIVSGQSARKEFLIDNAGDLVGKRIRVGLNELQGTRIWNRVITVP